ncbi:hypothetical protein C2G38_2151894 [Gigaspora rosea]|uniref:Uncharacterized protein n=1 Tax=Gigaspora rosea TaxID=44941 RepID=A0A397W7S4_9GLOM|nr:hypothetical protein C2G38_2151894 [Gigaspora rosea]
MQELLKATSELAIKKLTKTVNKILIQLQKKRATNFQSNYLPNIGLYNILLNPIQAFIHFLLFLPTPVINNSKNCLQKVL